MYTVEYESAKRREGFATKTEALMWAGERKLDCFEILDETDRIVYQEFPELPATESKGKRK